jgi:hypothetical protein
MLASGRRVRGPAHAVAHGVHAGASGLDYAAIPVVMDFYGVEAGARRQMFDDIRVMEVAALETIRGNE